MAFVWQHKYARDFLHFLEFNETPCDERLDTLTHPPRHEVVVEHLVLISVEQSTAGNSRYSHLISRQGTYAHRHYNENPSISQNNDDHQQHTSYCTVTIVTLSCFFSAPMRVKAFILRTANVLS